MAKDPAFLFYSQDFLTGTMFMTDEETGKYIKLLCAQHQKGGLIDTCAFDAIVAQSAQLRAKFIKTEHGYYNERLLNEMVKRSKKSNSLSENAKKRWSMQMQCNSNANACAKHMPIEDENESIYNDAFNKFWEAYPKKRSKGQAEKAFKKLKPDDLLLKTILDKIELLKLTDDWKKDKGQFIPYPATWLNAKGWEDEIETGKKSRWS